MDDPLVVVTHPTPIDLEARPIEHDAIPEGSVALGYYHGGKLIARGLVTPESLAPIRALLEDPVSIALAVTADEEGNIDGRICLLLPVDASELSDEEPGDEPWKASAPAPPELRGAGDADADADAEGRPHVVLLPIGNVIRSATDRNHPEDVSGDAQEMLVNLLAGRGQDAVAKAIDDLLRSI
jgi:hypothetical protein